MEKPNVRAAVEKFMATKDPSVLLAEPEAAKLAGKLAKKFNINLGL